MATETPIVEAFTPREEEVARLMARGYTNPRIAEELGITFATAKWHVSQVISKTGATSREEAVAIWKAEQAPIRRLRRVLAGTAPAALLKSVAVGAGVVVGVGVLGAAAILLWPPADDDANLPDQTVTPAPEPSPTDVVAGGPCAPENLLSGFLILGEGEAVPDCVGDPAPIPGDSKLYELSVPPGPYGQWPIDDVDRDGWLYTRNDTGEPAFAVYRSKWSSLPGRVVRGTAVPAVFALPGDGVVLERGESVAAWWTEDDVTYGLELFPEATGLNLEQVLTLLVFYSPADRSAVYWDPVAGEFVIEDGSPWMYPAGTSTGVAVVDQVIDAFLAGESLMPFADTVLAPCVANPPAEPLLPPVCADGEPEGTLVPAYLRSACPDEWAPLNASGDFFGDTFFLVWLYAVAEVDDHPYPEIAYIALFSTGERLFALALTDRGVAGIGGGGSCPTPDVVPFARRIDSWLLPPLYPLPPE